MPRAPLVLVVEDDYYVLEFLKSFLEQQGYRVATANEHSAAAQLLATASPALLISCIRLHGGDGTELAKLAHTLNIPVLLVSGEPVAIETYRRGTVPFLQKPFRLIDLQREVEKLLQSSYRS